MVGPTSVVDSPFSGYSGSCYSGYMYGIPIHLPALRARKGHFLVSTFTIHDIHGLHLSKGIQHDISRV